MDSYLVAGMMFIGLAASAVTASVAFFACTRVVDSAIPLKWRDPVREKNGSFGQMQSSNPQCVAAPPLAFCAVASTFILAMAAWHIVGAVYVFREGVSQ